MTREEFQTIAWRDFMSFAIDYEPLVAAFTQDTGRQIFSAKNRFEAMVDEATGKDADDAMAFMVWVTRTQWGWDEAPASFRKDAEEWERQQAVKAKP